MVCVCRPDLMCSVAQVCFLVPNRCFSCQSVTFALGGESKGQQCLASHQTHRQTMCYVSHRLFRGSGSILNIQTCLGHVYVSMLRNYGVWRSCYFTPYFHHRRSTHLCFYDGVLLAEVSGHLHDMLRPSWCCSRTSRGSYISHPSSVQERAR